VRLKDPNIPTPVAGIWWAWETITTVGYGDIVPVTFWGRILGVVLMLMLMLMGILIISLLTANFSAYFIDKRSRKIVIEEEILKLVQDLHVRLDKMENEKNQITQYENLIK
jgi:voltage-gated potassium channel